MNEGKDISEVNDTPTKTIKDLIYQLRTCGHKHLYLTLTPEECQLLAVLVREQTKKVVELNKELKELQDGE